MRDSLESHEALMPRAAGEFIARKSMHVSIDDDNVKATAEKLRVAFQDGKYSLEGWKREVLHPDVADEDAIDFIFSMDCLNFSFWSDEPGERYMQLVHLLRVTRVPGRRLKRFQRDVHQRHATVLTNRLSGLVDRGGEDKIEYGGKSYTGYWSLVAALRRAKDSGIPVSSAKFMASVGEEEARQIFQSSNEAPVEVPLLKERVRVMNEAGRVLVDEFNGSFATCVRVCKKDALVLLKTICKKFPSFRDEALFEGKTVAFYKRAQILIADIWACFEGKGLGGFHNIEALTMFADYRVPQALEYFGILRYSKELKQVLENLTVLEKGSRYEMEIRGCSIEAVERLKTSILSILSSTNKNTNDNEVLVNAITVDFYLWDFAKAHGKEMAHLPFHRVRSVFY